MRSVARALARRGELLYSRLPVTLQEMGDRLREEETRQRRKSIIAGLQSVKSQSGGVVCICGQHTSGQADFSELSGRQIVFVWNPMNGLPGSTLLRVFQSATRLAAFFPALEVLVCPTQSPQLMKLRNSTLVLHKNSGTSMSTISRLQRRSNVVVADYVDGAHSSALDAGVDGFICSSASEYHWVRARLFEGQRVALVPHMPDDRFIRTLPVKDQATFRCCYFGRAENCLFGGELQARDLLEIVRVASRAELSEFASQDWVVRMLRTPVSYIARPSERRSEARFKPFTKGFLAAQLGQIIIGARFDAENRYWLGDDYPFYVEEENLDSAIAAIKHAALSWEQGDLGVAPATLQRLRSVTCPVQNAIDYRDAFIHISR